MMFNYFFDVLLPIQMMFSTMNNVYPLSDGVSFRNTSRTSEEKHVRESLRHGVTTNNWFVHYLWDIYGGFGHNGKIIQRTLLLDIANVMDKYFEYINLLD